MLACKYPKYLNQQFRYLFQIIRRKHIQRESDLRQLTISNKIGQLKKINVQQRIQSRSLQDSFRHHQQNMFYLRTKNQFINSKRPLIHQQTYKSIIKSTDKLFNASKSIIRQKPSLIAVSINSNGGSIIQAKNIVSILKEISYKTSSPVYSFGEESVFGAANIVLAGTNRCFATKHSMVGQFGFSQFITDKSEFNKEHGIVTNHYSEATKGLKLDSNTPFTNQDRQWINNVLCEREEELKKEIIKLRAEKFHEKGLSNEELNAKLFNKDLVFGEEAAKYGLIDNVATFDQIINTEFPDAQIKLILNRRLGGFGGSAQVEGFTAGIYDIISPIAYQVIRQTV